MDSQKTEKVAAKKEMGIFITGLYLGCGERRYGERVVTAITVALPGLDGSIEIGVPGNVLKAVDDEYTMGQEITCKVEKPRAYKDRIYYNGLTIGDIVLF